MPELTQEEVEDQMPEKGKAATPEELKTWSTKKLLTEIKKQIRRDGGGTEFTDHCWKLASDHVDRDANISAKTAVELMSKAAEYAVTGSRTRIQSKLDELHRRFITATKHLLFGEPSKEG